MPTHHVAGPSQVAGSVLTMGEPPAERLTADASSLMALPARVVSPAIGTERDPVDPAHLGVMLSLFRKLLCLAMDALPARPDGQEPHRPARHEEGGAQERNDGLSAHQDSSGGYGLVESDASAAVSPVIALLDGDSVDAASPNASAGPTSGELGSIHVVPSSVGEGRRYQVR